MTVTNAQISAMFITGIGQVVSEVLVSSLNSVEICQVEEELRYLGLLYPKLCRNIDYFSRIFDNP